MFGKHVEKTPKTLTWNPQAEIKKYEFKSTNDFKNTWQWTAL